MHIALNGWFWNQPFVGSGQYLHVLVHNLKAIENIQLSIILPNEPVSVVGFDHINMVVRPPRFSGNLGKIYFEQIIYARTVADLEADIAHVPYWATPMIISGPVITTIFDVIPLIYSDYRASFLRDLYTRFVSYTARRSTHIITDSYSAKQDIILRLGIPRAKISVTWLAVDDTLFTVQPASYDAAVGQRFNLPDHYIFYIGGFNFHKNVPRLIEAFSKVYKNLQISLVLGGRLPKKWGTRQFPNIPEIIQAHGLQDAVIWTGEISEAEKASLHRQASLFVFPSRYEGFGLPVLEAMQSGTPVVACQTSSVPEIVNQASLLVRPDDVDAMAEAMMAVLKDRHLAENIRQRGLEQSRRFSWHTLLEQTITIYRQHTTGM